MHPTFEHLQSQTRRQFLRGAGQFSLGAIALQSLLGRSASAVTAGTNPFAPRPAPDGARVKRVIYLHMSGGPPHLDIFDYKPELVKRNGQDAPDAFVKGKTFAFTSGVPKLMGTPRTFTRHGQVVAQREPALQHDEVLVEVHRAGGHQPLARGDHHRRHGVAHLPAVQDFATVLAQQDPAERLGDQGRAGAAQARFGVAGGAML